MLRSTHRSHIAHSRASQRGASFAGVNLSSHLSTHEEMLLQKHPLVVYCATGRQRSEYVATTLSAIGLDVTVLESGYKGYRRFVLDFFERELATRNLTFRAVDGLTGSGKTKLLRLLSERTTADVLDYEGLAEHRGSLFGATEVPQPSQKRFESLLFEHLMPLRNTRVTVEREANRLGKLQIPHTLWRSSCVESDEIVVLESSVSQRAAFLCAAYSHFVNNPKLFEEALGGVARRAPRVAAEVSRTCVEEGDWQRGIERLLEYYDSTYASSFRSSRGDASLTRLAFDPSSLDETIVHKL